MNKILLVSIMLVSLGAYGDWAGNRKIEKIYSFDNGSIGIQFTSIGNMKVCRSWGLHLKFDGATDAGKNMLSLLLSAKISDRFVDVGYTSNTDPSIVGKDETEGCDSNNLSVLKQVTIQ